MSKYFSQLPDFEYVSRLPDAKISDYIQVKNLFKKGKLREDIFQSVAVFEKYQIRGDDRPDNVAFDFYQDSNLDWLVLTMLLNFWCYGFRSSKLLSYLLKRCFCSVFSSSNF